MRTFDETPQYLQRALLLMGAAPADNPIMQKQAFLQGSVELASGNLSAARRQFQQATARNPGTPMYVDAQLGLAEVELAAGDAATALQLTRRALQTAGSLQGGLPYSLRTGLAWLSLGRISQQLGDPAQARKAYDSAISHLSNTVDVDHPALLQARQLLSAM
jgi:tetratricopeptide (TPR) repeat protein